MSPADRARYLPGELESGEPTGSEAFEQGKFAKWLKRQQEVGTLIYFWQRTDRKATGTPGWPDFTICTVSGKWLLIEFKSPKGELSPPQRYIVAFCGKSGSTVNVVRSRAQAIRLVEQALHKALTIVP
jgi:mevalonate kinase